LSDKKVNKKSNIHGVVVEESIVTDMDSSQDGKEPPHSSTMKSEEKASNHGSKRSKLGSLFIILGILFIGLVGFSFSILPKYFESTNIIGSLRLAQFGLEDNIKKLSAQVAVLEENDPKKNRIVILEAINPALVKLESNLTELTALQSKQSEMFNRRIQALESGSSSSLGSSAETEAYRQAVSKIQADLENQRIQISKISDDLRTQAREVKQQTKVQDQSAKEIAKSNLTFNALDKIQASVESGLGYQTILAELSRSTDLSLSPAIVENAESGVASLKSLQNQFSAAARKALKKIRGEQVSSENESAVWAFVKTQLGFRSLTPQEGVSADAVLSRAQAAVSDGDIGAALLEIKTLTDVGQTALKEWSLAAESRIRVLDELVKLSDNLITN
jgi:hypothetical protein